MTDSFAMKRKLTDMGLYILAVSDIIKNNKRERRHTPSQVTRKLSGGEPQR